MKSLILMLIDESESMGANRKEVIVGFNEFLAKQKEGVGNDAAWVILIKFSTNVIVVNDEPKPIGSIAELTTGTYTPAGATALYDAIYCGIRVAESKEDEFDRVLCLIMTDGEENASRIVGAERVHKLLEEKEDGGNGKWTFLYIGEDPKGWAGKGGISSGNASGYIHAAPRDNFSRISQAVTAYRSDPISTHSSELFSGPFTGGDDVVDYIDDDEDAAGASHSTEVSTSSSVGCHSGGSY